MKGDQGERDAAALGVTQARESCELVVNRKLRRKKKENRTRAKREVLRKSSCQERVIRACGMRQLEIESPDHSCGSILAVR